MVHDDYGQLEPVGFTGKETDEEVGLVYFGERYLIPRLGRWASVDPLSVHALGGGEAMNGYHYVSGNLLQARDPLGLDADAVTTVTNTLRVLRQAGLRTILRRLLVGIAYGSSRIRTGHPPQYEPGILPGGGQVTIEDTRPTPVTYGNGRNNEADYRFAHTIEELTHLYDIETPSHEAEGVHQRLVAWVERSVTIDGQRVTGGAAIRAAREILGGYVATKVTAYVAARDSLMDAQANGELTQSRFDAIRDQYNATMATRIFGYTVDWSFLGRNTIFSEQSRILQALPAERRADIDNTYFGGEIPDRFEDAEGLMAFDPSRNVTGTDEASPDAPVQQQE